MRRGETRRHWVFSYTRSSPRTRCLKLTLLFSFSRGYPSRPPRSTPSKPKAKPRSGAGTTKNAAKTKAKAEGEGDESEASAAEGETKGAERGAPEHTPKEKLGIWILNNFKIAEVRPCFCAQRAPRPCPSRLPSFILNRHAFTPLPQAELTLKDDPVTASLKPAVMRSTLSELGAPIDDGEGARWGVRLICCSAATLSLFHPLFFFLSTPDVWSELVGDSDEPLEYDIWLKSESIKTLCISCVLQRVLFTYSTSPF